MPSPSKHYWAAGARSYPSSHSQQHARVAQRVGLHPVQVQELGDTLVIGTQELGIHLRRGSLSRDLGKAVPPAELDRKRQDEYPTHAQFPGGIEQCQDYLIPGPSALMLLRHGDRAYLGQILPHHVQCTTACDFTVRGTGHPELLDVLIQGHGWLIEQSAGPGISVDECPDGPDISRPGTSDRVVHPLSAFVVASSTSRDLWGNQGGPPGCQHPKRSWVLPIRPTTQRHRADTFCCGLLLFLSVRADHAQITRPRLRQRVPRHAV